MSKAGALGFLAFLSASPLDRLDASDRRSLPTIPTRSRPAYDRYLRGLVHFSRRAEDDHAVLRALQEFAAAVRLHVFLDPLRTNARFRRLTEDARRR